MLPSAFTSSTSIPVGSVKEDIEHFMGPPTPLTLPHPIPCHRHGGHSPCWTCHPLPFCTVVPSCLGLCTHLPFYLLHNITCLPPLLPLPLSIYRLPHSPEPLLARHRELPSPLYLPSMGQDLGLLHRHHPTYLYLPCLLAVSTFWPAYLGADYMPTQPAPAHGADGQQLQKFWQDLPDRVSGLSPPFSASSFLAPSFFHHSVSQLPVAFTSGTAVLPFWSPMPPNAPGSPSDAFWAWEGQTGTSGPSQPSPVRCSLTNYAWRGRAAWARSRHKQPADALRGRPSFSLILTRILATTCLPTTTSLCLISRMEPSFPRTTTYLLPTVVNTCRRLTALAPCSSHRASHRITTPSSLLHSQPHAPMQRRANAPGGITCAVGGTQGTSAVAYITIWFSHMRAFWTA